MLILHVFGNRYQLHYQLITFGKVPMILLHHMSFTFKFVPKTSLALSKLCRYSARREILTAVHAHWKESASTMQVQLLGLYPISEHLQYAQLLAINHCTEVKLFMLNKYGWGWYILVFIYLATLLGINASKASLPLNGILKLPPL